MSYFVESRTAAPSPSCTEAPELSAVRSHMVAAVVCALLCFAPFGTAAVVYAGNVRTQLALGDVEGAPSRVADGEAAVLGQRGDDPGLPAGGRRRRVIRGRHGAVRLDAWWEPPPGIEPGTHALRVRLAMADGIRLRSYAAGAGSSSGRRTWAHVGELQPELQPLGDHPVLKYRDQNLRIKRRS